MMGSSLDLPLDILRVDIVIYRLILFERGEQEGINSPVALRLISKHCFHLPDIVFSNADILLHNAQKCNRKRLIVAFALEKTTDFDIIIIDIYAARCGFDFFTKGADK
jgi:hypothetical protein